MPFRHANQYGGFDYPLIPNDGDYDFTSYDSVSDTSKSPYDDFTFLENQTEVAWSPTPPSHGFQGSKRSSPSAADLVLSSNQSPAGQGGAEIQPHPVSAVPKTPVTKASVENLQLRNDYVIAEDATTQTPTLSKSSFQIWDGAGCTTPNELSDAVELPGSASLETCNIVEMTDSARPVSATVDTSRPAMPSRQNSAGSASELSESGRNDGDKTASSRVRTTDSAKVRHNIVERRYRDNINAQVDVLRDAIVATMEPNSSRLGADELKRLTKAAVIAAATHQIKRARTENEKLLDENRNLQAQIAELEKLIKCGECPLMQLSVDMHLNSSIQPS